MNSPKAHPLKQLPAAVYERFNACVHCGLCLPACPTYVETMDEADSPRGRIHLMKAVVDGRIGASESVFEHLDRCLVCRACETACPSGVVYHELIEAVRPRVAEAVMGEGKQVRSGVLQWMVSNVLPYPGRAAAAMAPLKAARKIGLGGVAKKVAGWMGETMGGMAGMSETMVGAGSGGKSERIERFTPSRGEHRGAVVLLLGCVGSVVSGPVNAAAVQVLTRNGFDVHVLAEESCCGALAAHANDPKGAAAFAKQAVERLAETGDMPIISAIAGCGAQLKALHHYMDTEKAAGVAKRVRDITEFLLHAGLRKPGRRIERRVTYHDPCHLAHAQRIVQPPRELLAQVTGLEVVELEESDMCCGAAGTYALNQPEMAEALGRRKAERIRATGATELVTANVGCAMQIARWLRETGGAAIGVRHVVELLAEAYG